MRHAVAITCNGVSKSFALVETGGAWRLAFNAWSWIPTFEALKDVSFDVPRGQFVGILGRNGAGKSTLLRVIGGVYSADQGRISVNGAMSGLYELGLVGNPQLTGREYADRLLTVHGFGAKDRRAMVSEIHTFSELGDRFEDPVLTYSAGMTARLFFATATAGQYEVYLLDEILSVGDQHFQAKCWRRLRDRVSQGASGVLVTHDWSAIVKMCETAHLLEGGRVTYSGPAEKTVRFYLYGETARQDYEPGVARILTHPSEITIQWGRDLHFSLDVELLQAGTASCVCAIERLQPGFGWETALMTRAPAGIGNRQGRYRVDIAVPALPLDPGSYQISVHLAGPDPDVRGRLILYDGLTWLNGNGISLEVLGDPQQGLALPMRWRVEQANEVHA